MCKFQNKLFTNNIKLSTNSSVLFSAELKIHFFKLKLTWQHLIANFCNILWYAIFKWMIKEPKEDRKQKNTMHWNRNWYIIASIPCAYRQNSCTHVLLSAFITICLFHLATMTLLDGIETTHMFKCFAEPKPRTVSRKRLRTKLN